jgi:hypothetical protein
MSNYFSEYKEKKTSELRIEKLHATESQKLARGLRQNEHNQSDESLNTY